MKDPADTACRQCGFAEPPRAVEQDDGSMSDPTCLRCGLPATAQLPEIRRALARAWGLVASLRMVLENGNRAPRRESYTADGKRIGRPRKDSA